MDGAVVVYDIGRRTTFEHVTYWLHNLRERTDNSAQILILGHKTDQHRREVSREEAENVAKREQVMYA